MYKLTDYASGIAEFRSIAHWNSCRILNYPNNQGNMQRAQAYDMGQASYYRHQNSDAAIQERMQALIFVSFYQEKEKGLSG